MLPLDDLDTFVSTRDSLHRVAEHVVAKSRYVDDGEIRLTAYPGGFATPMLSGESRVRVDGNAIVVDEAAGSRHTALTTIAEAAAFVGMYGGPWGSTAANEFWNAAHFNGAVLPFSALVAGANPADTALQFFRAGRAVLVSGA